MSDASDQARDALRARWTALLAWVGASTLVPEIHLQRESWEAFDRKWEDAQKANVLSPLPVAVWDARPVDGLQAQAQDLAVAESNAARHGYVPTLGARSPGPYPSSPSGPAPVVPPLATPDLKARHPTAWAVDQAAPDLPGAPRSDSGPQDPHVAPKLAAVAAVAVATAAAAAVTKREDARIAIVIGGTLGTLALGWSLLARRGP
jgi:hypothetical protein